MSNDSPFATNGQEQRSEIAEEIGSTRNSADGDAATLPTRNIISPPPAYFPSRPQNALGADSPPPYEPRRDRSTYTDNVPLQDLRPLHGLDPSPVTTVTDNDTEAVLNEPAKAQKKMSRRACTWAVIFTVLGVAFIVILVMLLGRAIV
ncbi:hypothetical protein V1509DRAFT_640632 [Lipomyces kononenkoae]